ncbi:rRNA pseudouridine synthase [Candidatus Saccharibacteria bacterium]|nr:rRNA pseudouridine synthase [Candidatus Saccharibacteria bacterium]
MNKESAPRLNKFIAEQTGISRREADELIEKGAVLVNGEVARIGQRTTPKDIIIVKGQKIEPKSNFTYVMLNKPVGYVSSRAKQDAAPTLYELLPENYKSLKTVGRLDKESSGLILLTDDGDFALQMTHPKFSKVKIYDVELETPLEPLHQQMMADFGVNLSDGVSKIGLERISDDRKRWRVTLREGRNRQIRRSFGAIGYTITKLHRISFGNYHLGDLAPGETREVAP